MQFKHIIVLLVIASILPGCFWKEAGSWKNGRINLSQRAEFHDLDDKLLQGLKNADNDQLGFVESRTLIEDPSVTREVNQISELFQKSDFKLMDEYYVVNRYKETDTIETNTTGLNNYRLIYNGRAQEMYIAFFVQKAGNLKYMITAVFCKFSYGWKVYTLNYDIYAINGKTAPELYQAAQSAYDKQYFVNALNFSELAHSCVRPGPIWAYAAEDSINAFYYRLHDESKNKLKYPIVLNTISTHPKIFKVFAGNFNDGYYPMVYYQSSINISDTAAIRKENNAMMKVLPAILPGIDKDNKWLLFTAFNKLPNMNESVDRYEMDNRLK